MEQFGKELKIKKYLSRIEDLKIPVIYPKRGQGQTCHYSVSRAMFVKVAKIILTTDLISSCKAISYCYRNLFIKLHYQLQTA